MSTTQNDPSPNAIGPDIRPGMVSWTRPVRSRIQRRRSRTAARPAHPQRPLPMAMPPALHRMGRGRRHPQPAALLSGREYSMRTIRGASRSVTRDRVTVDDGTGRGGEPPPIVRRSLGRRWVDLVQEIGIVAAYPVRALGEHDLIGGGSRQVDAALEVTGRRVEQHHGIGLHRGETSWRRRPRGRRGRGPAGCTGRRGRWRSGRGAHDPVSDSSWLAMTTVSTPAATRPIAGARTRVDQRRCRPWMAHGRDRPLRGGDAEHIGQRCDQLGGGCRALGRVLGQCGGEHRVELRGERGAALARRPRRLLQVRPDSREIGPSRRTAARR